MQPPRGDANPLDTTRGTYTRPWLEDVLLRAFAWLATSTFRLTGDWRGWLPFFARTSAHLAVVAVSIVVVGLSNIEWPAQAASRLSVPALPVSAEGGAKEATVGEVLTTYDMGSSAYADVGPVSRLAQPHTIIPERPRLGVVTYTVQAGDTVQSIAEHFGLQPTTISWANPAIEDAPDLLQIGQEVVILPVDGALHKVSEDDTLASIAEEYKVEPEAIATCKYNRLELPDPLIVEGQRLIIPGGEKPYVPKVVTTYAGTVPEGARGTGRFQWPVLGRITQGYWYGHRAIDLGAATGSAVVATDGGFVSFAGWTDVGYGYLIVIDHANGFATYYAHLSNMYVFEGQAVERGQVIGAVGSTGWSTGPHLHFEVRYHGVQQNPRAYLP
jgi:murein DD-endopeptidase MepM/ murein hydrolase activator NlpD